ncbi:MAG: OmpA family protein [Candidatus Saccharimonadaceae bacterium]
MYQKIKLILSITLFIIGSFVLNAQTDTIVYKTDNAKQGEIVMTRSELTSFLEKVALAKKERVEQELENNYNSNPVSSYGPARASAPIYPNIPVNNMSRNDLLREIDALNARLNGMYGYGGGTGAGNSTTFLTTPGNSQGGYYPYQQQAPMAGGVPLSNQLNAPGRNTAGDLRWKIDSLQRQVSLLSAPETAAEKLDEISRLNREIDQAQDALIASSALTPEAKEIVKRYGTSEMKVYFDNDVSEVSSSYSTEVENAAKVLKQNPQLGVVLKGFASSVGNAKYNYDLSMRRNEAVKRLLIDYGVFPDQISSVFYGEDKSTTVSKARRVDIKFIIN